MTTDKDFRKSLKAPDRFQKGVADALAWLAMNQLLVWTTLILLVGIFGGIAGWQYYRDNVSTQRQEAVADIEYKFQKEEEAVESKRAEIQKEIDKLGGTDAQGKEVKVSADKQQKIDALNKKLEAIKPDHTASTTEYKKFYEDNKGNTEGWLAGLRYANALIKDKKLDDAKAVLEQIVSASKGHEFYQNYARYVYINVLAEQSNLPKAIEQVSLLEKSSGKDVKPQVLLLKVKLLVADNKKDEAAKVIEQIIKDHGASVEAQKAKSMKSVLLN